MQRNRQGTLLIAGWCICCAALIIHTSRLMSTAARGILFLHFQPILPPLLMLWLWGTTVQRFNSLGIDYEACFSPKDRRFLLHGTDIRRIAFVFTTIAVTACSFFCWACVAQAYHVAEFMPLLLYFGFICAALLPLPVFYQATRHFFASTCMRVLLPLQEVTWADFLLADIFCSLAKSSADFATSMCHLATGPVMQHLMVPGFTPSALCSPVSPWLLSALCLPYIIRFIQCVIVYRSTGNKAQIFNAAKYFSSFPALILSALEHEAHVQDRLFPYWRLWLGVMLFNTLYSFYWDVEQDWDMPWLAAALLGSRGSSSSQAGHAAAPTHGKHKGGGHAHSWRWLLPSLRPDALYAPRSWYTWALLSNLVLRLTWVHRLVGSIEKSRTLALCIAVAEAFRRYQWSYIRVETELRKVAARGGLGLPGPPLLTGTASAAAASSAGGGVGGAAGLAGKGSGADDLAGTGPDKHWSSTAGGPDASGLQLDGQTDGLSHDPVSHRHHGLANGSRHANGVGGSHMNGVLLTPGGLSAAAGFAQAHSREQLFIMQGTSPVPSLPPAAGLAGVFQRRGSASVLPSGGGSSNGESPAARHDRAGFGSWLDVTEEEVNRDPSRSQPRSAGSSSGGRGGIASGAVAYLTPLTQSTHTKVHA